MRAGQQTMTTLRLVLLARRVPMLLLLVVAVTGVSYAFYRTAINVDLGVNPFARPHKIPTPELIAVVTGVLASAILRPRCWEWERLGGIRVRLLAVVLAATAIALPVLPALVGKHTMPAGVDLWWILPNTLTMGGFTLLLSALLGPPLGGAVSIAGYFALALTDNLLTNVEPYLPLTMYPAQHGKWVPALCLVPTALAVHFVTRGLSSWAYRLERNSGT
ncbi:hypothetical protein J2S53_003477 [Actinopolyspora lacussalsi]|nr:hypothetical protein [Actinopolyspora lacussalsi]